MKEGPHESAARHLANLLGYSVAGYEPEVTQDLEADNQIIDDLLTGREKPDKLIIDAELDAGRKYAAADVVLAAIMSGSDIHIETIFEKLTENMFEPYRFERFMYTFLRSQWRNRREISREATLAKILEFGRELLGRDISRSNIRSGIVYTWLQLLDLTPSEDQINSALEILSSRGIEISSSPE